MNFQQSQHASAGAGGATIQLSFTTTPPNGNRVILIAVAVADANFTFPAGFVVDVVSTATARRVSIASKQVNGSENLFTVTRDVTSAGFDVFGYDVPSSVFIDGDSNIVDPGLSIQLGPIANPSTDAVAFSAIRVSSNSGGGFSISDSFTVDLGTDNFKAFASKPLSVSGNVSATWSWASSTSGAAALAVYGTTTVPIVILLPVSATSVVPSPQQIKGVGIGIAALSPVTANTSVPTVTTNTPFANTDRKLSFMEWDLMWEPGIPFGENEIPNGSFDPDLSGWTEFISPGATGTSQRTTAEASDGAGSLEIDLTNSGAANDKIVRTQTISTVAGEFWSLSVDVKGSAFNNSRAEISIQFLDFSGVTLDATTVTSTDVSGSFVTISTPTIQAPSGTVSFRVEPGVRSLGAGGTGKAWFDNIQLGHVIQEEQQHMVWGNPFPLFESPTVVSSYFNDFDDDTVGNIPEGFALEGSGHGWIIADNNQLLNSSFETDLNSWNEVIVGSLTGSSSRSIAESFDGIASLFLQITSSSGVSDLRRAQNIPASPGQIWDFSCHMKGNDFNNADALFRVAWLDSNSLTIEGVSVSSTDLSGEFIQLKHLGLVAPAGTVEAQVQLFIRSLAPGGTGSVWFDHVRAGQGTLSYGRYVTQSTPGGQHGFIHDESIIMSSGNMVVDAIVQNVIGTRAGVIGRAELFDDECYGGFLRDGNSIRISHFVGSGEAILATLNVSLIANAFYHVKLMLNGNNLRLRHWLVGSVEPGTWDIDISDAALDSTRTGVGFYHWGSSATPSDDLSAALLSTALVFIQQYYRSING